MEHSLSQMDMKAIKRKCVLDLVEDAMTNSLVCTWTDYSPNPASRLPFPDQPSCVWSSL